jgi:two-component system alkaline phosphatase synthesis response regulator PhoP
VNTHVLVAEDDEKQAELIRLYLEQDGHLVTVVHDGRAALDVTRARQPDLLVLDVMMPHLDGLEVCRILRRDSEVPVLLLTARSTEDDLLLGLGLGADDYLTKPYSPREMVARVRTLLRRSRVLEGRTSASDTPIVVGDIMIDLASHQLTRNGEPIDCTPGEFTLFTAMAAQPGRVFTRQQILEQLHGDGRFITERSVDAHIMNLRKKIELDPRRPTIIVTVFGVGYRLVVDRGEKRARPGQDPHDGS